MEILFAVGVLLFLVGSYLYIGYWLLRVIMRWLIEKDKDA